MGPDLRGDRARTRRRGQRCAPRRDSQELPTNGGSRMTDASSASTAVEISGVDKVFETRTGQVQALDAIDLTVAAGEFVSLIGPSGCGKSTLLRIVADLLQPTEGVVAVNGKDARRARLDQDYGIAFQQAGLLEWRTVAGNVELPLSLHG